MTEEHFSIVIVRLLFLGVGRGDKIIYFCPVNCSHNCSFLDFAAVVALLSEENSTILLIAILFVLISLKRLLESKGSKSWTDEASTMLFCSETDTGDT